MEIGLKYFSGNTPDVFAGVEEFADFLEILPVPGKPEQLKKFKKLGIKCTVHVPHSGFGFNPCNKKIERKNIKIIKESIKAADFLEADTIVMHPGFNSSKLSIKNPEQNMFDFFSKIDDDRIILENTMIELGDVKYILSSIPDNFKEVLSRFKFGFCLDFSHVTATSVRIKKDYKELIKEFLKLNPAYFHVSDNLLNGEDQHIHLGNGKLDMKFIKDIIKKSNKPACLEVPLDIKGRRKDVEFLRR